MNSRKKIRVPSYRLHRPSGQAVVTLSGVDVYLGRYGTIESREKYKHAVAEWKHRKAAPPPVRRGVYVADIAERFYQFAQQRYLKGGRPTPHLVNVRTALELWNELFGTVPIDEFGPLKFRAFRSHLTDRHLAKPVDGSDPLPPLARATVNKYAGIVASAIGWAVSMELAPESAEHAIRSVRPLRRGESAAVDRPPRKPVAWEHVAATLEYMREPLASAVRLQWLCGSRSSELLGLRTIDIDTSDPGGVWFARIAHHKTEHHGKDRVLAFGPEAQRILQPLLRSNLTEPIFCPARAESQRRAELTTTGRGARKRKQNPRVKAGEFYGQDVYRRAVQRAIDAANVEREKRGETPIPTWFPHQLRHSFAHRARRAAGVEIARAALGHSSVATTELYSEVDREKAAAVVRMIG